MYHKKTKLEISDFVFPYGELDQENRWVKMAKLIPWEIAEENYAKNFVDNVHPTHSARTVINFQNEQFLI